MDDLGQNGLVWRQNVESRHIWALTLALPINLATSRLCHT